MGGGTGARRLIAGGAALLVLVAVVGLASRAHAPVGGGHPRTLSGNILLEYVLLVFLALAVLGVPFWFYLFVVGRDETAEALPPRRNWMLSLFVTMTAVGVLSIALFSSGWFKRHLHLGPTGQSGLSGIGHQGSRAAQAVRFDWGPVVVVATLAVLGLAIGAYFLLRMTREVPGRPARVATELAVALDRTIADLRAEPDPRRAVIAAYAQMERALARAHLPRRPAEAPREYLGRVLPEVGAGAGSIERLTALFERAKFSPHAIDAEMKDEAIAALEALRDELRSPS